MSTQAQKDLAEEQRLDCYARGLGSPPVTLYATTEIKDPRCVWLVFVRKYPARGVKLGECCGAKATRWVFNDVDGFRCVRHAKLEGGGVGLRVVADGAGRK